jgi:hypothetical protein
MSDTPLSAQESSRRDCFVDKRLAEEYRSEATSSDGFIGIVPIVKGLIEHRAI